MTGLAQSAQHQKKMGAVEQADPNQVRYSGFLKDYSQLEPSRRGDALKSWKLPARELGKYDKFLIEQPYIYLKLTPDARPVGVKPAELKALADQLRADIIAAIGDKYQVVDYSGKNVARLKIAVTEMKPIGGDGVGATLLDRGSLDAGSAGLEVELTDSITEKRLAAAVDVRIGTGSGDAAGDRWSDTKAAFAYWAKRFRINLDEWHRAE